MNKQINSFFLKILIFSIASLVLCKSSFAQQGILNKMKGRVGGFSQKQTAPKDTSGFKHRDDLADSITISYRYLDSLKTGRLDSSVNDFHPFFSVPANYVVLGNNGAAGYPVLFTPILKAGWDAGFHAYDVYKFNLEGTKFYKTTRPFTQLTYLLASAKEQMIKVLHTQNIKPNWNFGFDYRLISSPGFFKTQNTNHNNYRLFSNYQGIKKRYAAYFVLVGNKISGSENGGIKNDTFLYNPKNSRRYTIPVNLGGDAAYGQDVFSTKMSTGNTYTDFTFFFRQSYDFGKRDSIEINDSTKEYLFYPKLRFQHTFTVSNYSYQFKDTLKKVTDAQADSATIKQRYNLTVDPTNGLGFFVTDGWKVITNDFVIRQFPETKNPAQFIEAGLRLENLQGTFAKGSKKFYNITIHGEYRNKTRNKKWDAIAKGEFYVTGLNAGDYSAYATLTRYLNKKFGDVQVSFQNVNRSPSYIFENNSSFNFNSNISLKKENTTVISVEANNPKFSLSARNISITNYTYFKDYYRKDQFSGLINLTQVRASKRTRLNRHFNLYSDFIVQQTTGNTPVHVPLFYTRQRLLFEGIFFKNLNLSTGLDVNYNTPYKANNYSPIIGQFIPQDSTVINNLPDIAFAFNFKIKSFTGLVRFENLNALSFAQGFGFTNNNFAAPYYPSAGLVFRIGVQWNFVN